MKTMITTKTVIVIATVVALNTSALAAPAMSTQAVTSRVSSVATDTLTVSNAVKTAYTGVIVDASGLGLETTFSPAIYDTNGRIVYGANNINPDIAISQGMVAYATSLEGATAINRAGGSPLVVQAVAVRNGRNSANCVNVIVSVDDGDRILLADRGTDMLRRCAVVIVK